MSLTVDSATVLRRFLEEVWNRHDLSAFDRHVHPDVRFHPPRGPSQNYAAYLAMATDFQRAFPDLHFEVERIFHEGEYAAARLVITGTNAGPWRGRGPTGRSIRVIGQPQCKTRDGLIVEFWQLFDEISALHQVGHISDASLLGHGAAPETG